jgi:hypothetical protein
MKAIECAGHIAFMGVRRGLYRVLVRKTEGKRPLGIMTCRYVDNAADNAASLPAGSTVGASFHLNHDSSKQQLWFDKYLKLYVQFSAPDDGRRYRLKHVEHLAEINKIEKCCNLLVVILERTEFLRAILMFRVLNVMPRYLSVLNYFMPLRIYFCYR